MALGDQLAMVAQPGGKLGPGPLMPEAGERDRLSFLEGDPVGL